MITHLEDYIAQFSEPEGEYLHRLWREINLKTTHGHMASGHLQGRLLYMLTRMIRPTNVLELGTFGGYSAICIAQGLDDGGHLWTIEKNDEMEDFARKWISGSDVSEKITLVIGDALKEAPKLNTMFDLVFLDSDKRTYVEAYEMAMSCLRSGGFIVADNTLWDGHVTDIAYQRDKQTNGIKAFNEHVAQDSRTEQVILPLRDGLTIIRKK